MVCGVILEAIPHNNRYGGVPGVGFSVAIVSETVARIHEIRHFGRVFQVRYVQRQLAHRRGEARRESKEMYQDSPVKAYQEAQEQTHTDVRIRGYPVLPKTSTCKGYDEATDT